MRALADRCRSALADDGVLVACDWRPDFDARALSTDAVDAAAVENIEVNVCGEMSGEPRFTPLLVGLGIRTLSATPRKLPDICRVVRHLRIADAQRVAAEALRMETAREVTTSMSSVPVNRSPTKSSAASPDGKPSATSRWKAGRRVASPS